MQRIILNIFLLLIACKVSGQTLNQQALDLLKNKCVNYPYTFAVIGDPYVRVVKDFTNGLDHMLSLMELVNVDFVIACGVFTSDGEDSHFDVFYEELRPKNNHERKNAKNVTPA